MSKPGPKAIHFGAGNIGRGFIGPLLVDSGYSVIFADVNTDLVRALNKHDSYDVHILDAAEEHRNPISAISGLVSTSPDLAREFADPALDLLTTAVGVSVLSKVATSIADGLRARRAADAGDMNVIACENTLNQTTLLRDHVLHALADDPDTAKWAREHVGFANCSVDRIVPPYKPDEGQNPLDVGVEGFYEWVVDERALHATRPAVQLKGVQLTTQLQAYVERKLYTLNCGHAVAAYLGFLKGHTTIDEAVGDAEVHTALRGALRDEVGAALVRRHGFDEGEYGQYVEKTLARFANPRLKDHVARVGREPIRKLSRGDRLLGPFAMAREYGLPTNNLAKGIAAAFLFDHPEDEQSVHLQTRIKAEGISKVIADTTEYQEGSAEHGTILEAVQNLRRSYTRLD